MERRKYAMVSAPGKAQGCLNRSTSDGSPANSARQRDRTFSMMSKKTSEAFKKRKSSSFSAEAGTLSRSNPMDSGNSSCSGSGAGRPRSVSESQENVDCSTIKLLQNLTSLIVCARNTSSVPHTLTISSNASEEVQSGPSTITTVTSQPEAKFGYQSTSDYNDSSQVAIVVRSMNSGLLPDGMHFNDSPSSDGEYMYMDGCQEPIGVGTQTLDAITHPALSRLTPVTDDIKDREPQSASFSSSVVSSKRNRNVMDTTLPFSESDSGSDVDIVSQITRIQGLVNTITNSNKLESSYSNLCVLTDQLEQETDETKLFKSTTDEVPAHSLMCEGGLAKSCSGQEPQPAPTNTPQEFNHGRPQELDQRSNPAPLGCTEIDKEFCSTAPGPSVTASLSLKERSSKVEVECSQSTKKLDSTATVATDTGSLSPYESKKRVVKGIVENNKEPCSATGDTAALSLYGLSEERLAKGDSEVNCFQNNKATTSGALSVSHSKERSSKEVEVNKELCSAVTVSTIGAAALSLSDSKERSGKEEGICLETNKEELCLTAAVAVATAPPSLSHHSKQKSGKREVERLETNNEVCSAATVPTVGAVAISLSDSKERSGKEELPVECSKTNKELCSTAPVPTVIDVSTLSLSHGEERLNKENLETIVTTGAALSLSDSKDSERSGKGRRVPIDRAETNGELFSTTCGASLSVSDSDSKLKSDKGEGSLTRGAVPERCAQSLQLMIGSTASGVSKFSVLQEANMSHHPTTVTRKQASKSGHSSDDIANVLRSSFDLNDLQPRSNPQLQMPLALLAGLSDENDKTDSTTEQSNIQQDDINSEPSQLQQEGEEREPSLSDSEVTLSAMSSEEQGGGGQNGGEASKKSTTSLTQKRRKKRLHSNPKRRSSKSGDGRMSGAPGPSCASERVSQEVALKATQARKLLAKSKATVSLRQRQKRREAEHSGVSVSEDLKGSRPSSSLRRGVEDKGEGEKCAGEDTSRREGVRKSQRVVKGKRMLYISEDEASDEECSPTPAKRGKKSSPRSQSHPLPHGSAAAPHPAAGQPLMGDFLATILTDIPEVDICSLSSLSTNSPSTSQRDTSADGTTPKRRHQRSVDPDISSSQLRTKSPRTTGRRASARQSSLERVAESPRNSPQQASDKGQGVLPRLYNLQSKDSRSSSSKCPSPEVGLQNKKNSRGGGSGTSETSPVPLDDRVLQDSEESRTHYRVLMSWEADYLHGTKATRGPILYAMEKVREQLDSIEGPWMNKAKFIWTTWRHRVSPKVRSIYTKKAKENRKELYGKNKVVLNIRRPAPKVVTTQRQSARNIKIASQQKKCQDQVSRRPQPRPRASSAKKQPKKPQKSVGSRSKSESKLSPPNLASSSGVGGNSVSSKGKDESGNMDRNVLAAHANTGVSHQQDAPSLVVSTSKSNTRQQSSTNHKPLCGQQAPSTLSTVDSGKEKSSPSPVPPPPAATVTVSIRGRRRQSIQFTENSLKVSFKRAQSSSPAPAPKSFVLGTNSDVGPSSSKTTSPKTVKRNSSKKARDSLTGSTTESSLPSSQQLADFFTSMTPLPAPVSPKRKRSSPHGNVSSSTNSLQSVPHSSNTSNASIVVQPPCSNVNVNGPNATNLLLPGANSVVSIFPPHSDTFSNTTNSVYGIPFLPHSDANANTPVMINTSLIHCSPTCTNDNYSSNAISAPLSHSSATPISTPKSTNTPPICHFDTSSKSSNATPIPHLPYSSATTIGTPNSTNTPQISNLGTSSKPPNATTMLQLLYSSATTVGTPSSTNMPQISTPGTSSGVTNMPQLPYSSPITIGTPNSVSTGMPLMSNLSTNSSGRNMQQVPYSTATTVSAPSSTSTLLISNLGTSSKSSGVMNMQQSPQSSVANSTPNSTNVSLVSNAGTSNNLTNTTSLSPPIVSSPTTHCSITTQARLTSEPSTSLPLPVAQSESQSNQDKGKTNPPKPTFSSIYQQLVADKKIKPSKSAGKKPPRKKKSVVSLPPSSSVVGGGGTTSKGSANEKGAKKSTKQGLSSKLSSPLCTTFPTFVIPHMPMCGGGTDPNLLVSPVWLGPGSFSGLMSTMPYQAPPPTAPPPNSSGGASMDNAWSQGTSLLVSSSQVLPSAAGNDPLKSNCFSTTTIASQTACNQPSPLFGFSSPQQFGSFHGSGYSGLPAFPVDLQLNPLANNSGLGASSSVSSDKSPPCSITASKTTTTKSASDGKQNATAKSGRKRPRKLITSPSKATNKGSNPTSEAVSTSMPSVSSPPESSGPHIDMYPDSPPTNTNQQMGKTLQYRPLNESLHDTMGKSPNTQHNFQTPIQSRSLSTSSTTPMSPPTHIPINRFRFPSLSSPLALPSSLPSTTFSNFTTMLKSPTGSTSATSILSPSATCTSPTAPGGLSLTTQPGVTASNVTASSSSSYVQDVNSLEYRKLILKRVQQWNEHKQKMQQGHTEHMKLKSPPMLYSGSILSGDAGQLASPSLRTALTSSSPGFTSHFKIAVDASRESSPTSMILGLGSPKLLTVGPPVTLADTLAPRPSSNPPSSLELKSPSIACTSITPSTPDHKLPLMTSSLVTSPTVVPSVVGNAVRMDDILTASYGCSVVAPSIVFNSSFMGDISSMSRWELEQLYKHNMEKLEQQKKFISILEAQLKRVREQHNSFSTQKPSQSELYQRFLSFIVEPNLIPDVSSICSDKFGYGHLAKQSNGAKTKPPLDFNEVIKGGTFDRPVLNEKYDFYAKFGRS